MTSSPLGIVQQDEHAGTAVVLETLVVMPVGVTDEVIEHGRVDDVQQSRPSVVRRHFLHRFAVALVVLPPVEAQTPKVRRRNGTEYEATLHHETILEV